MFQSHPNDSGYRWVILFIFASTLLTMGLQTYTLSSISFAIQSVRKTQLYSVEEIYIELCSFIFYINYALLLVPAYYFDDRFNSRRSLQLGSFLSFLGASLRIGCKFSFWWIVAGSFISSLSQPFLLNQVTKLSVLWFQAERRATATSISMFFFMLGGGGSFAVSGAFVDENSGKSSVFALMILEASLSFVSFVLVCAFFKDKTSNSESFLMLMHKTDVKKDLEEVMRNKNFIYLFLASIISCGNANFYVVTIAFITGYFEVGADKTSALGSFCTFSGLASCLAAGYLASAIGRYKKICVITMGLSAPLYVGFFLVQGLDLFAVSIIVACFLGSCIMPIYSLALELACEIAFPVREVITSGLINCFTQIFGLLPIFVAYWFDNNAFVIVAMLFFLQIIALVLMMMVRENLRRHFMETMSFARVPCDTSMSETK